MSRTNRAPSDLVDAAAVHAAREQIVHALGLLAARPLDEGAAEQMREALDRSESPAVRAAVRRMVRPGETRPNLVVVTPSGEQGAPRRPAEPPGRRNLVALVASGGDAA
ncbi:hypothetical protein Xcel_3435 (plasmid) [Xylanimonas cellulosilytica DSM 15894]|uniref:Uncharacterized protein n=1 Tax=Xylanimonas cellulosilytica (strain DSM 15894 / JCM 12276 / CECT 5975 / KCTC 9989 / LMG 20990 / NBRC 107835 / XIL07) TaxID=446471 RepID=D1C0W8_XYLCX|nr:hypothetical protein [Xylanimonas cellulosilytica]ACZ32434.1 hypothetical protein Xcel_3435 [Xylanimonas cellulosilytica DSM 15894]